MKSSFRSRIALVMAAGSAVTGTWGSTALAQGAEIVLEEITITASRRVETAQRAAISVAAIPAEALANVGTNPGDLTRLVPSIQIAQVSGVYPQATVRGVGNNPLNPYTDSTVGFNYDGVPITRVAATSGLYYDLQRVEVLKGPQGTLYGRNQTGGAINIIPRTPVLGQTNGYVTLEGGSYSLKHGTGAFNLALGQTAALRAAFNIIDRDGYYHSGLADDVGQSGRVQVRLEPNDNQTYQLGLDYHHQGGKGGGSTLLNSTFVGPAAFGARQYATDGKPLGGDPWVDLNSRCDGVDSSPTKLSGLDTDDWYYATDPNSPCRTDAKRDDTFWGVTGLAEIKIGSGTLTLIPAFRSSKLNSQTVGNPNLRNNETSDTTTLETRYASANDGRFSYIVGAFLLGDKVDAKFEIPFNYPNNRPTFQGIQTDTKSWAAFAAGRLSVTDSLRLTAGARYTHDEKTFAGTSDPFGPDFLALSEEKKSWGEATYNAGIEFDVAPDSLLYLNYARGYKAGGFFFATKLAGYQPVGATNTPSIVTGNSYNPEHVNAITLGSKNYFLDKRLLVNAEVFNYKYKDQQNSQFGNDDWTGPIFGDNYTVRPFLTINIGGVDIKGIELETQFLLTKNTLLSLNLQRLKTDVSGSAATAGRPGLNAPNLTATAGIQQTFPLGKSKIVADLHGQYRSKDWIGDTSYQPFMEAKAVTTGDFSLSFDSGSAWRVMGYVNNFTDEVVPVFYQGSGTAQASPNGPPSVPFTAVYRAPRTYGARVTFDF